MSSAPRAVSLATMTAPRRHRSAFGRRVPAPHCSADGQCAGALEAAAVSPERIITVSTPHLDGARDATGGPPGGGRILARSTPTGPVAFRAAAEKARRMWRNTPGRRESRGPAAGGPVFPWRLTRCRRPRDMAGPTRPCLVAGRKWRCGAGRPRGPTREGRGAGCGQHTCKAATRRRRRRWRGARVPLVTLSKFPARTRCPLLGGDIDGTWPLLDALKPSAGTK